MNKDISDYFFEKYKKASITVVPGEWPDFKSYEEVDKWVSDLDKLADQVSILLAARTAQKSK